MKTSTFINSTLFAILFVAILSIPANAQKAYHRISIENGISELNTLGNRIIEKLKIKFEVQNAVSTSESDFEAMAENELNEDVNRLIDGIKFESDQTILVTEAGESYQEMDLATEALIPAIRFDVEKTELALDNSEEALALESLIDTQMEQMRFDVSQSATVSDASDAMAELEQLTDTIINAQASFNPSELSTLQAEDIIGKSNCTAI